MCTHQSFFISEKESCSCCQLYCETFACFHLFKRSFYSSAWTMKLLFWICGGNIVQLSFGRWCMTGWNMTGSDKMILPAECIFFKSRLQQTSSIQPPVKLWRLFALGGAPKQNVSLVAARDSDLSAFLCQGSCCCLQIWYIRTTLVLKLFHLLHKCCWLECIYLSDLP